MENHLYLNAVVGRMFSRRLDNLYNPLIIEVCGVESSTHNVDELFTDNKIIVPLNYGEEGRDVGNPHGWIDYNPLTQITTYTPVFQPESFDQEFSYVSSFKTLRHPFKGEFKLRRVPLEVGDPVTFPISNKNESYVLGMGLDSRIWLSMFDETEALRERLESHD